MMIFWLTCLVGYPRTSAPEPNKWKLAYHIRNTAYFGHRYGKNIWVKYLAAMPFILRMYGAITFNFIKGHKYSFSDYGLFWRMMRRGIREELGKM